MENEYVVYYGSNPEDDLFMGTLEDCNRYCREHNYKYTDEYGYIHHLSIGEIQ